jgi:uncharacterized protein (DUF2062 family)
MELRDSPHAIAGGVAIGIFFGFTPLFGLKTLLALGTAWVTRTSKLAAVIVVSLHDLLTPIAPVLLRVEYDIGYWLLSHPHHLPPKLGEHHLHFGELMKWTTFFNIGLPMLIGSLFIAAPCAAVGYAAALQLARVRRSGRLPAAA